MQDDTTNDMTLDAENPSNEALPIEEDINPECEPPTDTEETEEPDNFDPFVDSEKVLTVKGMFKDWFLDYASEVILERAVPHLGDGLKPVQRRILHTMKILEDGRYNKVANIIGQTMQYHPHGDASIGDALVNLGQKNLLIDTQGNWGNIYTGDGSAAPRYIEARLSKFALDVVFNAKTTEWKLSYDGRKKEPVTLPIKFPLLLAQGAEGIAVGLASKILPHNFIELLDASIACLRDEHFELYPDFLTGGYIDVSKYNDGRRGGSVRIRAVINKVDSKTLVIDQIPYGRTSGGIIESILKANEKGKIKIKKIDDNTSNKASIVIHLATGISPDKTIDALYAFTDCEISISNNYCTIENRKPRLLSVTEMLRISTERTVDLLRQELNIRLGELEDDWHYSSLEKIFFEQRIYRCLEKDTQTWEDQLQAIDTAFDPFRKLLRKEITQEDILKLTEKPVRRISKFDIKKADEHIRGVEKEMEQIQFDLLHLTDYAIRYFERIKQKYGKGRERKTEIRSFDNIEATKVVIANAKLYINREEGFVGYGLKKDEYITDCSDLDDIIVIRKDGTYTISKIEEKKFVGKNILYANVFKRNDNRTIYNVIYKDGKNGSVFMKRCAITGITRGKEYDLGSGKEGTAILYLSVNPNGESEILRVTLRPLPRLRKTHLEVNMADLAIKGRGTKGNLLTKYPVQKVTQKEKGVSTLGGTPIYWDKDVNRLNIDKRGTYIGEFVGEDKMLITTKNGLFRVAPYDVTQHLEEDIDRIEHFDDKKVYTAIYFDKAQQYYYLKRFPFENATVATPFIAEDGQSELLILSDNERPRFSIVFGGNAENRPEEIVSAEDFIGVKSLRAKGKRLTTYTVKSITEIEPLEPLHDDTENDLNPDDPDGLSTLPSEDLASTNDSFTEADGILPIEIETVPKTDVDTEQSAQTSSETPKPESASDSKNVIDQYPDIKTTIRSTDTPEQLSLDWE